MSRTNEDYTVFVHDLMATYEGALELVLSCEVSRSPNSTQFQVECYRLLYQVLWRMSRHDVMYVISLWLNTTPEDRPNNVAWVETIKSRVDGAVTESVEILLQAIGGCNVHEHQERLRYMIRQFEFIVVHNPTGNNEN